MKLLQEFLFLVSQDEGQVNLGYEHETDGKKVSLLKDVMGQKNTCTESVHMNNVTAQWTVGILPCTFSF